MIATLIVALLIGLTAINIVIDPVIDLVIDTVPVAHDLAAVRALLEPARGKLVLLGVHPQSFAANYVDKLLGGTAPVTMSWIGGTACTREVVDLCARRRIAPEIEVVPVSELPAVLEAIDAGNDAGRRYVLDLATLPRARALRAPAFSPAGAKKYDAIGAAQLLKPFFSLLYAANPAVVSGVAQIVFGLVVLLGARAAKALRGE